MTKRNVPRFANELAERSVLGAMLRSADAYWQVSEILQQDYFTKPIHREIFGAVKSICEENKKLSITLIESRLPEEDDAGQDVAAYLSVLASDASDLSALDFAEEIAEAASKRNLIRISEAITKAVNAGEKPSLDIASAIELKLQEVIRSAAPERPKLIGHLAKSVTRKSEIAQRTGVVPGLGTGLHPVDEIVGTMMPGDFIILMGAQGDGKSAMGFQIGDYIAQTLPVLGVQMEMSGEDLAAREMSWTSKMSVQKIYSGEYSFDEGDKIRDAENYLQRSKMYVQAVKNCTVRQIRNWALNMKRTVGLALIIIDQLDKIKPSERKFNKFDRMEEVTADLKALAIELGVPIICLVQRTRTAQRNEEVPTILDADGPSIERDADMVIAVWRKYTFLNRNKPSSKAGDQELEKWEMALKHSRNHAGVILLKGRRAEPGTQRELRWNGKLTRFTTFDQVEDDRF